MCRQPAAAPDIGLGERVQDAPNGFDRVAAAGQAQKQAPHRRSEVDKHPGEAAAPSKIDRLLKRRERVLGMALHLPGHRDHGQNLELKVEIKRAPADLEQLIQKAQPPGPRRPGQPWPGGRGPSSGAAPLANAAVDAVGGDVKASAQREAPMTSPRSSISLAASDRLLSASALFVCRSNWAEQFKRLIGRGKLAACLLGEDQTEEAV